MDKSDYISPCGLACFNCSCFKDNTCKGCYLQKGECLMVENCATYNCIMEKGLRFCFECTEFPCTKLQPVADGAASFPHNTKVYNLCRMKLLGVEKWAEEESLITRERYFNGKFVIGTGPVLEKR